MSKSTDMYMDELENYREYVKTKECSKCGEKTLVYLNDTNKIICKKCNHVHKYFIGKAIMKSLKEKIIENKVYMAGKIGINDWRHSLVPGLRCHGYWDFNKYKNYGLKRDIEIDNNLIYTGPFFISCDHGCSHGESTHGVGENVCVGKTPNEEDVFNGCKKQISDSDYIFCWIDSLDCYGTLFELGIAYQQGKKIFIGMSESKICSCNKIKRIPNTSEQCVACHCGASKINDDLWFIKQSGESNYYGTVVDAWNAFLDWGPMKVDKKEKEEFVKTLNTQELEDFEDIKNKQPMSKTINYFKRNRKIVDELKKLYNGKCQICQDTFEKEDGTNYCETHHVKALGKNGTDTIDNLVVLCPTCHKKLHFAKEKEFDIKYKEEHYKLMEMSNE